MTEVQEGDLLAGKYRVERVLGEGGMGVVVAATHVALDERVAVKFMSPRAAGVGDAGGRFLREARAAVRLKSEHVARVRDVGSLDNGAPYIVMEYLEGSDLAGVLAARGKLPLAEAVDYLLQVCDAIAEAHAQGIIHRDLKPANIFVTQGREGEPLLKVLDFGISKMTFLGEQPDLVTRSTAILGSPMYMSPEQMKSSRDVTPTTDIWSLGIILYEAVGGRVPFHEETMGALMAKVLTEPPAPLEALRPDLPAALFEVVARCLDKDPAQRFTTVVELARALAPFATPPSEARIARIEAATRNVSLVPQDRASRESAALGVAATLPMTGSVVERHGRRVAEATYDGHPDRRRRGGPRRERRRLGSTPHRNEPDPGFRGYRHDCIPAARAVSPGSCGLGRAAIAAPVRRAQRRRIDPHDSGATDVRRASRIGDACTVGEAFGTSLRARRSIRQ